MSGLNKLLNFFKETGASTVASLAMGSPVPVVKKVLTMLGIPTNLLKGKKEITPEVADSIIALISALEDYEDKMMELELKAMNMSMNDIKDARESYNERVTASMALKEKFENINTIGFLATGSLVFLFIICMYILSGRTNAKEAVVMLVLQGFFTLTTNVYAFFFGSSHQKSDTAKKLREGISKGTIRKPEDLFDILK